MVLRMDAQGKSPGSESIIALPIPQLLYHDVHRLTALCVEQDCGEHSNVAYAVKATHSAPSIHARGSRPSPRRSRAPASFEASAGYRAENPRDLTIRHRATPPRPCAAGRLRRLGAAGLPAWLWDRGRLRAWPRSWLDPRLGTPASLPAAALPSDRVSTDYSTRACGP